MIDALKSRAKQKRVLSHCPNSDRKSKKPDDHVDLFGILMIVDQFGNGWHKSTAAQFVRQRIEVLSGNGWHK